LSPWNVSGVFVIIRKNAEVVGLEAEQMVDLLRRVRHDFANHLQVISGYLDMEQPARVKQYLAAVMEEIIAERIIFESQHGEAAIYFYEQILMAYDFGIKLRYEDLDIDCWELLKASGEPCKSLALLSKELNRSEEETIVYLSVHENSQGMDMFFTCAAWEESTKVIRVNKE
jgi:hypothetical protein